MNPIAQRGRVPGNCSPGFSLVELMVVVAICAVLATVAVPAYVNQVNRSKQTDAVASLMQAKMEQEVFWANTSNWSGGTATYAINIGCLPSFGNSNCLANCSGCTTKSFVTSSGYALSVLNGANGSTYTIQASRTLKGTVDTLAVTPSMERPLVQTPNALKFSWFQLMFGS